MTACANCGSPGIDTTACALRGSCKMHYDYNLSREQEYARQRGEKHHSEMSTEERDQAGHRALFKT